MLPFLLVGLLALSFGAKAVEADDDGFIWIDANTRIKVKPLKAGGGATAPETAAPQPEPQPEEKPEEKPESQEKPQK